MYEQPFNPFAQNLAVVKEYFRTGKVLARGICQAIAAVLGIIGAVLTLNNMPAIISAYMEPMISSGDVPDYVAEAVEQSARSSSMVSSVISVVVSAAIAILIAVAFILIYTKSRNEDPSSSPKAGVMILYVLAMIQLVCVIILAALTVLALIALIWLVASMRDAIGTETIDLGSGYVLNLTPDILIAVIVGIAVALLIMIIILLIVTINKKNFYSSVRKSITTVELHTEGAKGYGVLCVIGAVFAGLSLLSIPSTLMGGTVLSTIGIDAAPLTVGSVISALSSILNFIMLILEAGIALGYKRFIDDRKYGYSAPPVMSAPYGAGPTFAQPQRPDSNNPYADAFNQTPPSAPQAAPTCPSCGAPVDPNAPFCSHCGSKIK